MNYLFRAEYFCRYHSSPTDTSNVSSVLRSSEAYCLFGVDFLEDNHCAAVFYTVQLRLLHSQTVSLFHNRKAPSDPQIERVNVIARETTFILARPEAVILGEPPTQTSTEKSEGIFEPSPAIFKKYHLLAFRSLCESGDIKPAGLFNLVEDVMVHKGTSLGSFSVVGFAELGAKNRVIADLPDQPQGQVPDKKDVKE